MDNILKIEINLDNDAFQENPNEIARILENLAKVVADPNQELFNSNYFIRDSNGNRVGFMSVEEG